MNFKSLKRLISAGGVAIALSALTPLSLTAQTSRPTNPPATSPDGKPVESYDRNTNVTALNNRILAAARRGGTWVTRPLSLFTRLAGEITAQRYALYVQPDNVETPSTYTLTYITSDFLDDSVGGKWIQYALKVCQPGECPGSENIRTTFLLVQEIRTANYCRRPGREVYSSAPCP
jgi:hypothetical protein